MQILRLLREAWNHLVATVLLRRGVSLYRRGEFGAAATHIHEALLRAGPSFPAHLYLGRIYLRLNRFDRARQEFAQARFIDPGRFAAKGLAEDLLLEMAENLCRPERQPQGEQLDPEPAQRRSRVHQRSLDDFSSPAERDRFRALPPIRPEDIENLDWEDMSRLLDE